MKRKISPMSVRWEERLWPIINKLRGELIDKDVRQKPMTKAEKADLETLQKYADYYIGRRFPVSKRLPRKLEKLLAELGKE